MKAERVVLDTNVLISAVLRPDGPPRTVVDAVRSENGVLLFSNETFEELRSRFQSSEVRPIRWPGSQSGLSGSTRSGLGMGFDRWREARMSRSG